MIAPHYVEALQRVKKLIEENIITPLDYSELCRRVRISEDVLIDGFRELFNTSPYQYYMDCKFREIEKLLLTSSDKIATISNVMGYEHVSSFVRAFKKRYRCTPGAWRKLACSREPI
jgi:AraC family transcriptional regulator, transcriptional activator of the genes for pyochelin and ferripyochelin receptors